MSFWLGTHSSSCYSSCKPEVREVWLSLHSANGNEHPSCQQYYFLTLQVKCQQHIRTLKNATKPLGLEVTKSCSLSSDLSALWIYSSAAIQGQWPWGMPYTTAGTSAHNALVTGHPASERSSLLSPSNSAGWKECQLHYSGSPYSPISWDCYPEKPPAQENSVWPRNQTLRGITNKVFAHRSKYRSLSSLLADPEGHRSASVCSVSSSPTLIHSSWVSSLLHFHKVQRRQWIQISVNLAF